MDEIFFVSLVFTVIAGNFLRVWWSKRRQRVAQKAAEIRECKATYEADVKLWELLHEDDPAWLVAMGIEPPRDILIERERRKKAEELRDKHRREMSDLRNLKPLTAYGSSSFDRSVEQQLEQKLLRPLEADFLRAMQQGNMNQAELLRNQLAQQEQRFQQQQHDRRMDGMMGMGSLLGALGGEMFLGRRH